MIQMIRPMTLFSQTTQWRLWIDRCGGFSLLSGDQVKVGGTRPNASADVQVKSDWRRFEGTLVRRSGDYFWAHQAADQTSETLLHSGSVFPISGSATLRIEKPSPLSGTAVLSLDPPHRFDHHVDKVLLVDQTLLIGPSAGDHIRCTAMDASAVLVVRDGVWRAKLKSDVDAKRILVGKTRSQFVDLVPGQPTSLGELDMMLEEV